MSFVSTVARTRLFLSARASAVFALCFDRFFLYFPNEKEDIS